MVRPTSINPLGYIIQRQYDDGVNIKNKIFKERLAQARNLYRKDLYAHYGCVNAIEFSEEGELLVSGGDDRRVLLWSVPEALHSRRSPVAMQANHISNIFCVAFDSKNTKIFSGGNDDQVIIHDINTRSLITKLPHKKPVYGLSINTQNDDILATAGDDGKILLFDIRESPNTDAQCLAKQKTGFHSVMFNPTNPRFLVTANSEEGIALWDCRKPKEVLVHYDSNGGKISGISACFDQSGKRLLALRRRLPPVLYATQSESAICQFYHPQYYNSCTMKTCCFAGDSDEYILSGSDDFNLYMWQIPNDDNEWGTSHIVLKGHRSIVNQVRYNKHNNLIASSGVEKMVKLWTTVPIGNWQGSLLKDQADASRSVYTHDDYIRIVGNTGERISHDYSDRSTLEDSKMMAFFDSLIQREIEGWDSPSDNSLSDSDSDGQSQYWNNLVSEIYRNNRGTDDLKKHKSNRIAHLIYKKRNCLAKMAHDKSKSAIRRYHLKEKSRKRKNCSKQKSNKAHKFNGHRKKVSVKCDTDESDSRKRLRKYRTRQSLKDIWDSSTSNNSYDAPSTSTGITNSNSSLYRVIEQDSEEDVPIPVHCEENGEVEENNFVNILPTPLNGTHDMFVNVLETNGNTNGNVVTVRNEDYTNHASTSNGSRYTCSSSVETATQGCASTSTYPNRSFLRSSSCTVDSYTQAETYTMTYHSDTESDSDFEFDYHTPVKKRRTISASDSGCATGPSSSNSFKKNKNHQECSNNNPYQARSSEDEYRYEKFRKRIKKAGVNIRKQIGVDSDSN